MKSATILNGLRGKTLLLEFDNAAITTVDANSDKYQLVLDALTNDESDENIMDLLMPERVARRELAKLTHNTKWENLTLRNKPMPPNLVLALYNATQRQEAKLTKTSITRFLREYEENLLFELLAARGHEDITNILNAKPVTILADGSMVFYKSVDLKRHSYQTGYSITYATMQEFSANRSYAYYPKNSTVKLATPNMETDTALVVDTLVGSNNSLSSSYGPGLYCGSQKEADSYGQAGHRERIKVKLSPRHIICALNSGYVARATQLKVIS